MADVVQRLVMTPKPTEIGLSVEVRESLLANNPGLWPSATGTIPYKDFASKLGDLVQLDQSYAKGYSDYVFTYGERGSAGAEADDGIPTSILYFAKNKTDAERNTPFKTWWTKRNMTFDAVLDGVAIFSTVINDQQIWFPKYFGLAEYVGPCLFKIEQFLSEVPWNSNSFQATAPQPQPVDAWVFTPTGQSIHIFQPRVLHPKLEFDSPGSAGELVFKTGLVPSLGGNNSMQYTFAATQPAGRSFYIYSDSQDPTAGQYLRERATIYPPTTSQPLNAR